MSTWVYFVCIDHDPPLVADAESGQHNEVEAMRALLANRQGIIGLSFELDLHSYDRDTANGLRFFYAHPRCRLACRDEYDRWTDLGQGLPEGVKTDG